jgi:hypothetical protein
MSTGKFCSTSLCCALWLLAIFFCFHAQAQDPSVPSITFTYDFPGTEPDHYLISIAADGHASYDSDGKISAQSETSEPFRLEFTLSAATRTLIFDLAKRTHYFEGNLDSGRKNIASTGAKTLAYRDSEKNTQSTYNYSPNPAVMELTGLFQNLSTTLEFGRRLQYMHRYQKLALDAELKRMEDMSKEKQLAELAAVAPILQEIVNDTSLVNVVRARAQRLLAAGQKSSAS